MRKTSVLFATAALCAVIAAMTACGSTDKQGETGDVAFYETYDSREIRQILSNMPNYYENLSLLGDFFEGPVVSSVEAADTAAVNRLITSDEVKLVLPDDLTLLWTSTPYYRDNDAVGTFELIALRGEPVLTGADIAEAEADVTEWGGNVVNMRMTDDAARRWRDITGRNTGRCIAIVIDGKVYSSPRVNDVIEGGRAQIYLDMTEDEAEDLARRIRP